MTRLGPKFWSTAIAIGFALAVGWVVFRTPANAPTKDTKSASVAQDTESDLEPNVQTPSAPDPEPGESFAEERIPPGELSESESLTAEPAHPITPERERMQREIALFGAAKSALRERDTEKLRALLDEHRSEFGEDPEKLREGYEILLDCLERPSEHVRQVAREYYDRERASTLRRTVRKVCLTVVER